MRQLAPANGDFERVVDTPFARSPSGRRTARCRGSTGVQDHQRAPTRARLPSRSACQLSKLTSLPARSRTRGRARLHFAAVVADLDVSCPSDNLDGPHGGERAPTRSWRPPPSSRQGLDPGQKTKPIHAEMDCVHRVRQRRHRNRGGNGFRAAGTTGIISHPRRIVRLAQILDSKRRSRPLSTMPAHPVVEGVSRRTRHLSPGRNEVVLNPGLAAHRHRTNSITISMVR